MKKLFILFLMMLFVVSFVYARGNETNECTVDSDCDADEVCVAGECEDENGSGNDDECAVDTDCDADEVCIAGECEDSGSGSDDDECVVDADCTDGRTCIDGDCEDLDDSGSDDDECTSDADCTDGRFCVDGDCEDVGDDSDDDLNDSDDDSNNKTRWLKECIADSALRNMNDIQMKLKRAEQAGEMEKVRELKAKLDELAMKIRTRTAECQKTFNRGAFISEAVKLKDGSAAGIVNFYKTRLSEISLEENETQRLEALRALRADIDKEIKTIMESKRQIRSDDMDELVERIEVRADKIKADDVEVDSKDRSIITEINGKEVEIKVTDGQVKIEVDGVEADTGTITIENNTLFYNGVAIKTLPSDALVRYKLKVKEMELEQKENRLVYKVKYEESRKILGMFKAKAEREAEIDADDGNKLEDKGPWWNWMSTRDGSVETEVETELETETETTG